MVRRFMLLRQPGCLQLGACGGPGGVVARTHASRPVAVPCHPGSHGSCAALARTPCDPSGLGQGLRRVAVGTGAHDTLRAAVASTSGADPPGETG